VIGWTGSFGNLPYLEAIEPALHRFMLAYPSTVLRIVCDKPPSFRHIHSDHVEYVPWSPKVEATSIQTMDVGLMPLEDSLWARGKCSFKMLQYMSCQIPVIVSPVGMNTDVLALGEVGIPARTTDEWYFALEHYYTNRSQAALHGRTGREVILRHFSQRLVAQQIAEVFRELA
jgi:glycosyltransferase involved in cell wall biosynthesis